MAEQTPYIKIIKLKQVTSTNDYLLKLANKGEREITVILAETQTKGRGRRRRKWISPKGKGLYVSFLFRPDMEFEKIHLLSLMTALAAVKALKKTADLRIKWPNDILLNNKKIGGILAETTSKRTKPRFVIVGLGLNIAGKKNQLPKDATSLFVEKKPLPAMEKIFKSILKEVIILYSRFKQGRFTQIASEASIYLDTLGKKVTLRLAKNEISAVARKIDSYGALIVDENSGRTFKVVTPELIRLR